MFKDELPTEGRSPDYKISFPKDCHKVFIFKSNSLDHVRDAMIEMGKAVIGIAVLKFFYTTEVVLFTVSAAEITQTHRILWPPPSWPAGCPGCPHPWRTRR